MRSLGYPTKNNLRGTIAIPKGIRIIAGFPFFHISFGHFFLERIFPGSRIVSDIFKSFSDKTEMAPRILA